MHEWQDARRQFAEHWIGDVHKVIVSNREDGLGERLRALCNAMAIAGYLGVDFRFVWPAMRENPHFHVIQPADEVFDPAFAKAHEVADVDLARLTAFTGHSRTPDALRRMLDTSAGGILVQQPFIHHMMDVSAEPSWPGRFRAAFDSLPFVPELEAARQRALNVPLPPHPVAIHLRAGDIIYGEHRFGTRFISKAMSYPMARRLVVDAVGRGWSPVLFGQDADMMNVLVQGAGAVSAVDRLGLRDASPLAQALADFILMSRCETIYAGNSGFAMMASALSMSPVENPVQMFSPQEIVDITCTDPDLDNPNVSLPPLQRAFAWFMAWHAGKDTVTAADQMVMLQRARDYEKKNGLYHLQRAVVQARAGRAKGTEREMKGLFRVLWPPKLAMKDSDLWPQLPRGPARMSDMAPILETLEGMARPRYPYTCFYLGLVAAANRDWDKARLFLARSPAADPSDPYHAVVPPKLLPKVARAQT